MAESTVIGAVTEKGSAKVVRESLLICGILSSVLYVSADIAAAISWHSYSYVDQSISELFAIGSPVKWIFGLVPYSPLILAFGIGVLWSAGRKRALRITGALIFLYGVASEAGSHFPMHLRGATGSLTDTMHIICTIALVLFMFLFVGFGATADGRWFRLYSVGTIIVLLVCGGLAGAQGPRIAADLPTPWLGVEERMNVYSAMLWVSMLAAVLLVGDKGARQTERHP